MTEIKTPGADNSLVMPRVVFHFHINKLIFSLRFCNLLFNAFLLLLKTLLLFCSHIKTDRQQRRQHIGRGLRTDHAVIAQHCRQNDQADGEEHALTAN